MAVPSVLGASARHLLRLHHSRTLATQASGRKKPKVLVLGTGWGGNRLARQLDKSKFDVEIVSPANHFLFTPYLPSTAVGALEFRVVQEPVRTIPGLGAYFQAKARSIDLVRRVVLAEDIFHRGKSINDSAGAETGSKRKFDLPYDALVIATGCKTNTFNTPGIAEREGREVHFLKHLHHARVLRNRLLECFERAGTPGISAAERSRLLSFVVVGGGPTSCEFTAELSDFVRKDIARLYPDLVSAIKITIVEAGPALLGSFDQTLVKWATRNFKRLGIDVRTSTAVTGVEERPCKESAKTFETIANLSDGSVLPFGLMVWSAGLAQVKLVANSCESLRKGPTGRLLVDKFLRTKAETDAGVPAEHTRRVFALGDCAVNEDGPLAPLAQVAEQQADYLAHCFNSTYHQHLVGDSADGEFPTPVPTRPSSFPIVPSIFFPASSSFRYVARGGMVSMGAWHGVVDLSGVEKLPPGLKLSGSGLSGVAAWLTWNGTYLTKQLSLANLILNPLFKMKCLLFGRDVSRF